MFIARNTSALLVCMPHSSSRLRATSSHCSAIRSRCVMIGRNFGDAVSVARTFDFFQSPSHPPHPLAFLPPPLLLLLLLLLFLRIRDCRDSDRWARKLSLRRGRPRSPSITKSPQFANVILVRQSLCKEGEASEPSACTSRSDVMRLDYISRFDVGPTAGDLKTEA